MAKFPIKWILIILLLLLLVYLYCWLSSWCSSFGKLNWVTALLLALCVLPSFPFTSFLNFSLYFLWCSWCYYKLLRITHSYYFFPFLYLWLCQLNILTVAMLILVLFLYLICLFFTVDAHWHSVISNIMVVTDIFKAFLAWVELVLHQANPISCKIANDP